MSVRDRRPGPGRRVDRWWQDRLLGAGCRWRRRRDRHRGHRSGQGHEDRQHGPGGQRGPVSAGEVVGQGEGDRPERGGPTLTAATTLDGVLSHGTAAAHWLLESALGPSTVEVTVPRASRRRPPRGVLMHFADLDPDALSPREALEELYRLKGLAGS